MKVQMMDLRTQYLGIKQEIDSAIQKVLLDTHYIKGEEVKQFEESAAKYLGVKHVIGNANGTDALQLALMALDLKEDDEVITPSFTFVATCEVIALLKLKIVFVEVDEKTFNIDTEHLKKLITPKTKAIIPVHLFGQSSNMEEIMNIANENKIAVIEDVAQAFGADFTFKNGQKKKTGTIGTIGCSSFFPTKNLGCYGDGGACFTNDDELANKIRMIGVHGSKIKYQYEIIGVNSRLDTMQAAILNVKMKYLDKHLEARKKAGELYNKLLTSCNGIELPFNPIYAEPTYNQYTIKIKNEKRDELKQHLESKGIPTMIYYPYPVHTQKPYLQYVTEKLLVSEKLCKNVLSLPMHTELKEEEIEFVCKTIVQWF